MRHQKPGETLTLQYKGKPLVMNLVNHDPAEPAYTYASLIRGIEHINYIRYHGYSAKPVPLLSPFAFPATKRYDHPDVAEFKKKEEKAALEMSNRLAELLNSDLAVRTYRFSEEANTFVEDSFTPLVTDEVPVVNKFAMTSDRRIVFENCGTPLKNTRFHFIGDYLYYHKFRDNFEDISTTMKDGTIEESTFPNETASLINLRELGVTAQNILYQGRVEILDTGYLILHTQAH